MELSKLYRKKSDIDGEPVVASPYKKGMEDGVIKVYNTEKGHPMRPYIHMGHTKVVVYEDDYIITQKIRVPKEVFERGYIEIVE